MKTEVETCSIEGCDYPVHGRKWGWCRRHYDKWRAFGTPMGRPRRVYDKPCTIEGCDAPQKGLGFCNKHYQRFRIHGTTDDPKPKTRKSELIANGYRLVYAPEHPHANLLGYVAEHRKVMGEILGRPLYPDEHVHHRNGDRLDNRPANLELWTRSHPSGQRAVDLVTWAREMKARYADYRRD